MASESVRGKRVGKYELLVPLTRGGMAELFLGSARGPGGFEKYVVIKRILPSASSNEAFVSMFLDEARITAGFSHANIVQTYDLGEDAEGLYVVMEFIAGANLNQVFNACVAQQAVLPVAFSAAVVRDCALALHHAHTFRKATGEASPVIHRDVAQKNIMVAFDGQVKLLDFGIAKARGALTTTSVGTVKGTTGYMSPEQVRGEPLDGRSDVFSLGVVLWEMTTGERLFAAETELQELQLILEKPIRPSREVEPSVPEELSDITLRCLARERADRFASARELARALDARCGPWLQDQEARAAFMAERFEGRIADLRALMAAGELRTEAQLVKVAAAGQKDAGPVSPSTKVVVQGRPGAAKPVKPKGKTRDTDEDLLMVQARADALTAAPQKPHRTWSGPFFMVVVAVALGLFAWKVKVADTRPASSGLKRFAGDPTEEELAELRQSEEGLSVVPPAVPLQLPDLPTGPAPAATPTVELAPPPSAPPTPAPVKEDVARPVVPRPPAATGSVTLALFPEGLVFLGPKELGHGTLVTLTLPVGTHLLRVVGADGSKRKLWLPVVAGKNPPMRLRVDELPTE